MKEFFAVAALVVSIGANIPYIIDILKGKAKPERISWLLWTLLGLTYYFSAVFADGAKLFTFGELIGPVIIFVLALKYGVGGKSKFDLVSLAIALIAFALLFIVEGVLAGLVLALIIDGIGATLTIRKLLLDPTSESRSFWLLGAVASIAAHADGNRTDSARTTAPSPMPRPAGRPARTPRAPIDAHPPD